MDYWASNFWQTFKFAYHIFAFFLLGNFVIIGFRFYVIVDGEPDVHRVVQDELDGAEDHED